VKGLTAVVSLVLVALLALAPASAEARRRPDLVVSKVSNPPPAGLPGTSLVVSATARNRGRRRAGRSRLGFFLSTDRHKSKTDFKLRTRSVRALRHGKHAKARTKPKLPTAVIARARLAATVKAGSYYLIACADATHRVRESNERNNCRTSKKLIKVSTGKVPLPAPPPPPPGSAGPALHVSDGLDFGELTDFSDQDRDGPGDPQTTYIRFANNVAGQQGYTRTTLSPQGELAGATTELTDGFSSTDDAQQNISLPFQIPFYGTSYSEASVSTNGWVGFGDPAQDYWPDLQLKDFRGGPYVVTEFERGAMPFFGDLDTHNNGPGHIYKVAAADGSAVAFRWEVDFHEGSVDVHRRFQVVFFSDGRIRYDYLAGNDSTSSSSQTGVIGLSSGDAAQGADFFAFDVNDPPSDSILYTPNAVSNGSLPAGTVSTNLPAGSTFTSADAGCALAKAPTVTEDGQVTCSTPALGAGATQQQRVNWTATPEAFQSTVNPPNVELTTRWLVGGSTLTDYEESDQLAPVSSDTTTAHMSDTGPGSSVSAGDTADFDVTFQTNNRGLYHPVLRFQIPAGLKFVSADWPNCSGAPANFGGGTLTCPFPSGAGDDAASSPAAVKITVDTQDPGTFDTTATVSSGNAPDASAMGSVTATP
jgi:hypothetical protein